VEEELPTLPEHVSSPSVFIGVRVTQYLVFCVAFCRLLFALLSVFIWPLLCLSFDLRLLITLLVFFKSDHYFTALNSQDFYIIFQYYNISCNSLARKKDKFEDTKRVIRSRKSKDRQSNGQMKTDKRANNNLQNATQKTKY
jgi:hypothetical protein